MKTTSKEQGQNRFCSCFALDSGFHGNSVNNLLSYCGLIDAEIRASYKDLPVPYKKSKYCGNSEQLLDVDFQVGYLGFHQKITVSFFRETIAC